VRVHRHQRYCVEHRHQRVDSWRSPPVVDALPAASRAWPAQPLAGPPQNFADHRIGRGASDNTASRKAGIRPDADIVFPAGRYALVLKGVAYDFIIDGPLTDPVHCLERTDALNAPVYAECRKL